MTSINILIHGAAGGQTSHNRGSAMHVLAVILCITYLFFPIFHSSYIVW